MTHAQTLYDAIKVGPATGGFTPGGLQTTDTRLIADDIHTAPGTAGSAITQFSLSLADVSGSPSAFTTRANVGFWLPDGVGGGPGSLLATSTFLFTLQPGGEGVFSTTLPDGLLTVPTGEVFWAGVSFTAASGGGTPVVNGQLNGITLGLFDPPTTVGSTTRTFFETATGYAPTTSNPAGDLSTGPNTRNFGWRFASGPAGPAVPEPSALAWLAASLPVGTWMLRKRRKHSDV